MIRPTPDPTATHEFPHTIVVDGLSDYHVGSRAEHLVDAWLRKYFPNKTAEYHSFNSISYSPERNDFRIVKKPNGLIVSFREEDLETAMHFKLKFG